MTTYICEGLMGLLIIKRLNYSSPAPGNSVKTFLAHIQFYTISTHPSNFLNSSEMEDWRWLQKILLWGQLREKRKLYYSAFDKYLK